MRILVTGGAGFIGANFLALMVSRHPDHRFLNVDKLTYAANPASLADLERRPNYAFHRLDLVDEPAVREVVHTFRPDRVVHFAAESHVDRSIDGPGAFIQSNVVGTFHLLEACRQLWGSAVGRRFHHVGTDEVYGSLGPMGHAQPDDRYDPSSPYAASKAASDHLVRAWGRTWGLPVTLSLCTNNYGPRQHPEKLIPLMILNAMAGRPLPVYGDGAHRRDWLYVDDHCEAIWRVLEAGEPGRTYHIAGGEEQSNLEVVQTICREVAAHTGQAGAELEGLIAHVADRPGHDRRYALDDRQTRQELDWRPQVSFAEGLTRTVAWYLNHPEWVAAARTPDYQAWLDRQYGNRAGGGA